MYETFEEQVERLLNYPDATQASLWGGIERIDARARAKRNSSRTGRVERYELLKIEAAAGRLLYFSHHRAHAFDTTDRERALIERIMALQPT